MAINVVQSAIGRLGYRQPNGVQAANEKQQLQPLLKKLVALPATLGEAKTPQADDNPRQ